MVSAKKKLANQRNAKKSTGPNSADGTAKSAQNSTIHGFFSTQIVLDGENEQEYLQLLNDLVAEHKPQTPTQMLFVKRIAGCMWKLERVTSSELFDHRDSAADILEERFDNGDDDDDDDDDNDKNPDYPKHPTGVIDNKHVWSARTLSSSLGSDRKKAERSLGYEQKLQNMIHRALCELRKLRKERKELQEMETEVVGGGLEVGEDGPTILLRSRAAQARGSNVTDRRSEVTSRASDVKNDDDGSENDETNPCAITPTTPSPRPSPRVPGEGEDREDDDLSPVRASVTMFRSSHVPNATPCDTVQPDATISDAVKI